MLIWLLSSPWAMPFCHGFGHNPSHLGSRPITTIKTATRLDVSSWETLDINHHAVLSSNFFLAQDGGAGGGVVDIIRNFAIAVTAIVFLGAGVTFLTASVLIPAAAKELEQECKDLAPEMWDEYQALLEPGQTMAQRPDLMQELGAKLQPLLDAKIERGFAEKKSQGIDVSEEERAWKAIDNFNAIPNRNEPPQTSTTSSMGLDLTTTQDQWDDDDVIDVKPKSS